MAALRAHPYATVIAFFAIVLFSFTFLYFIGIDAIELNNDFQFFADSSTYHSVYKTMSFPPSYDQLVGIGNNFAGPIFLIFLTFNNYYLISLICILMLFSSTSLVAKNCNINVYTFFAIIILNPMTISSLLAVNKEVISFLCIALFTFFIAKRSITFLFLSIVVSILVRWQLTIFIIMSSMMLMFWDNSANRRLIKLSALLFLCSAVYILFDRQLGQINDRFLYSISTQQNSGSGLYELLVRLQFDGFYFAVFPLKAAHLLFGLGLRFDRLFNPTQIYNDVFQLLSSTSLLVVFILLLINGKFSFRNNYIYVSAIYLIIFTLTPIYAPRYFYPVYILWAIVLASQPVTRSPQRNTYLNTKPLPSG